MRSKWTASKKRNRQENKWNRRNIPSKMRDQLAENHINKGSMKYHKNSNKSKESAIQVLILT